MDSTDGSLTQDSQLLFIQRNTMDRLQAGYSNWIAWNRIETNGCAYIECSRDGCIDEMKASSRKFRPEGLIWGRPGVVLVGVWN